MKVDVYPSIIKGSASAPGSKSIAQRMAACALLAKGESTLLNYPDSEDCKIALEIAQNLGAIITTSGNETKIRGGFPNAFQSSIRMPKSEIFCGESGLSSRMYTPIAALYDKTILIKGAGSLLSRPFSDFETLLPQFGAECKTNNGLLPIEVKGPLKAADAQIEADKSSQFLTGILLALPKLNKKSTLTVKSLTSKPYVDMTIEVAAAFGIKIKHTDYTLFEVEAPQAYQPVKNTYVPGDWSGASFLLVAGALCAKDGIYITNLNRQITQADSALLEVLKLAGVNYKEEEQGIYIRQSEVNAFEFDANQCPDLFPPLAALAAFANGVSIISGVKRLTYKESNRAKTLQEEFGKAGVRIVVRNDEMKVYPSHIRSAVINSHNDHRIAMAAALLGLAGDKISIKGAECVAKSFPHYFDTLKLLGANIHL